MIIGLRYTFERYNNELIIQDGLVTKMSVAELSNTIFGIYMFRNVQYTVNTSLWIHTEQPFWNLICIKSIALE